ncbi:Cleavage polyadenylation factor subunit clp1 [Savitreella phatthalungensis]
MGPLVMTGGSVVETLRRGQEYRFEVDAGCGVSVTLRSGQAEVFGSELTVGPAHCFSGCKAAVYSWSGCEIEVTGTPSSSYVSDEAPLMHYLNAAFAIDDLRAPADGTAQAKQGPRVLVVGPDDAGKSSLVRTLAAYAGKLGRSPVVVNLDPREGTATCAGTISAFPLDTGVLEVVGGFGSSSTTGASEAVPRTPIVYTFGAPSPAYNLRHFKRLMSRLAIAVNARLETHQVERRDGLLIDSSGLIDRDKGQELLHATLVEFAVDTVLVMGNERLTIELTKRYSGQGQPSSLPGGRAVTVVKLPKSGGVVDRDGDAVRMAQQASFSRYFYGDPAQVAGPAGMGAATRLNTFSSTVLFDDVRLWKVDDAAGDAGGDGVGGGAGAGTNSSLMPIGTFEEAAAQRATRAQVSPETPSSLLVDRVVAVLACDRDASADDIARAPTIGFLHIRDVDDAKRRIVIGSAFQGRLPHRALLVTTFKFSDK